MNLIDLKSLERQEIEDIFLITDKILENPHSYYERFKNLTVVLFFPEDSIRTRVTFERGISLLGGQSILFSSKTLDKKEEIEDVIGYLENWVDLIVVRHKSQEKIEKIAQILKIPVINAMSEFIHPCEILADLYSFRRMNKNYTNMTYTFVGENANILRSWAEICEILSFKLNHVFFESERLKADTANYSFYTDMNEVIAQTDLLMTDPIPENNRTTEYYNEYQINFGKLARAKNSILVNPCPPFNRGGEISDEIINSKYFVGYSFKKNLLHVQQAIMLKCLGRE